VAEGTPAELKRLVPGGHVRLEFADPGELDSAARALAGASREDETLALLDRLDEHQVGVESLSTHTPDLDDVFLALTGHPSDQQPDTTTAAERITAS